MNVFGRPINVDDSLYVILKGNVRVQTTSDTVAPIIIVTDEKETAPTASVTSSVVLGKDSVFGAIQGW